MKFWLGFEIGWIWKRQDIMIMMMMIMMMMMMMMKMHKNKMLMFIVMMREEEDLQFVAMRLRWKGCTARWPKTMWVNWGLLSSAKDVRAFFESLDLEPLQQKSWLINQPPPKRTPLRNKDLIRFYKGNQCFNKASFLGGFVRGGLVWPAVKQQLSDCPRVKQNGVWETVWNSYWVVLGWKWSYGDRKLGFKSLFQLYTGRITTY